MITVASTVNRRALIMFVAIAYGWAWLVFVPMVLFHLPIQWLILATVGPSIAAVVTHRVTTGSYRAFRAFELLLALCGLAVGLVLVLATDAAVNLG